MGEPTACSKASVQATSGGSSGPSNHPTRAIRAGRVSQAVQAVQAIRAGQVSQASKMLRALTLDPHFCSNGPRKPVRAGAGAFHVPASLSPLGSHVPRWRSGGPASRHVGWAKSPGRSFSRGLAVSFGFDARSASLLRLERLSEDSARRLPQTKFVSCDHDVIEPTAAPRLGLAQRSRSLTAVTSPRIGIVPSL